VAATGVNVMSEGAPSHAETSSAVTVHDPEHEIVPVYVAPPSVMNVTTASDVAGSTTMVQPIPLSEPNHVSPTE